MILLDSDHLSVLTDERSSGHATLKSRLRSSDDQAFATTIVNVEEQIRGWFAFIKSRPDVHDQIPGYQRLADLLEVLAQWRILRFDSRAADEVKRLRKQKIRIGTMDLKIAAIALTQGALLLSRNLVDFRKVPGLQVESWLSA